MAQIVWDAIRPADRKTLPTQLRLLRYLRAWRWDPPDHFLLSVPEWHRERSTLCLNLVRVRPVLSENSGGALIPRRTRLPRTANIVISIVWAIITCSLDFLLRTNMVIFTPFDQWQRAIGRIPRLLRADRLRLRNQSLRSEKCLRAGNDTEECWYDMLKRRETGCLQPGDHNWQEHLREECPVSAGVLPFPRPNFSTNSPECTTLPVAGSTSIRRGTCHLCCRLLVLRRGNRIGRQFFRPQPDRVRSMRNCMPSAAAGRRSRRWP